MSSAEFQAPITHKIFIKVYKGIRSIDEKKCDDLKDAATQICKEVNPKGQAGKDWVITSSRIAVSKSMKQKLDEGRIKAAISAGTKNVIKIQKCFRGYSLRKKTKNLMKVWKSLREALSDALIMQFKGNSKKEIIREKDSKNEHKIYEEISNLKLQLEVFCKNEKIWDGKLILEDIESVQELIQDVIQTKHTLRQLIGHRIGKQGDYDTERAVMSSKDLVLLLSYGISEGKRIDEKVLKIANKSVFKFDPTKENNNSPIGMLSTAEFQHAVLALNTIKYVQENIGGLTKRIGTSDKNASDARKVVESVTSLNLGVVIAEVKTAKKKLEKIDQLVRELEEAIDEKNIGLIQKLKEQLLELGVNWKIMEFARIKCVEFSIRNTLRKAILNNNVQELGKAIQMSLDKQMEEAIKRKKKKQKKLRAKWISKKKAGNVEEKEDNRNEEPVLNIDDDVQSAKRHLKELLNKEKRGKPIENSKLIHEVKEQEALTKALDVATNALNNLSHNIERDEYDDIQFQQQEEVREVMDNVMKKAHEFLGLLREDLSRRSNLSELLIRPEDNPNWNEIRVSSKDLNAIRGQIESTLSEGEMVGISMDLENLNISDSELTINFTETELKDATRVTELRNCSLELNDYLDTRRSAIEEANEVVSQIACTLDSQKSEVNNDFLMENIIYSLKNCRITGVEETKLKVLQQAFEAIELGDSSALNEIALSALEYIASAPPPTPNSRKLKLPHTSPFIQNLRKGVKKKPLKENKIKKKSSSKSQLFSPSETGRKKPSRKNENQEKKDVMKKLKKNSKSSGKIFRSLKKSKKTPEDVLNEKMEETIKKSNLALEKMTEYLTKISNSDEKANEEWVLSNADLFELKSKVENLIKDSFDFGLNETNIYVSDLEKILSQIEIHLEERSTALQNVEEAMAISSRYPFSSNYNEDGKDFELSERDIENLKEKLDNALTNGRLVGLTSNQLQFLRETFEDFQTFLEGRYEMKDEVEKTLKMAETVHKAHPTMQKAPKIEAKMKLENIHDFLFFTGAQENESQSSGYDEELIDTLDLMRATFNDCSLFGISSKEPFVNTLKNEIKCLNSFILVRKEIRSAVFFECEKKIENCSIKDIKKLLSLAKMAGLIDDTKSDNSKMQRGFIKAAHFLKKRQSLLENEGVKKINEKISSKNDVGDSYANNNERALDELDRKLSKLVPEARERLRKAMEKKNPIELSDAINTAKGLETRLQKLRQMRANKKT